MPDEVPLSVKIRLGFEDRNNFLSVVEEVAESGAQELVIHARTKADGYRPPAYWAEIARAGAAAPDLRIIANGEIWSVEDARRAREEGDTPDLMLGRGVLCRPDLPRLLRAADSGADQPALQWQEIHSLLGRYLQMLLVHYDARYACNPIKQWLGYLRHYYPQAAMLFAEIKRIRCAAELQQALGQSSGDTALAA